MFRILARNTFVNGLAVAIRVAVSFALTSFLVNRLGNELYGLWTLGLTFTLSGALSLFSLGFQGALVKYVAQYHAQRLPQRLNKVISATLLVYAGSAAVGCALMCGVARWWLVGLFHVPAGSQAAVKCVAYLFSFQLLFELPGLAIDAILEGLQRYDIRSLVDVFKSLLFAGGAVAAAGTPNPVVSLAVVQVVVTAAAAAAVLVIARALLPGWRLVRPDGAVIRDMFGFTNDLLVLRINGIIYNNMDKWIIGASLASTAIAEYDIANRMHGLATVVMSLASAAVMPATSALDASDARQQLRVLMVRGTKYTLAIALPVVVAIATLARPLLAFWISPAHTGLAIYVQLFMAYVFFWAMTPVYWNMLVGVKATRPMVRIQVVSVAINLAVTLVLVRRIGVAGAMLGTLVGNAVAFVPYTRLAFRRFDISARDFVRGAVMTTYPQAAVAGLALLAITRLRPPSTLLELPLYGAGCVVAFGIAMLVTGLDADERTAIRAVLCRRVGRKSAVLSERISAQ